MGAGLVHDAFESIVANGYVNDIVNFFKTLIDGLQLFFGGNDFSAAIGIFQAVGGTLLIIYFCISLTDCIEKDILSLDKFVVFMIRLFVGSMIMIYLPEIIQGFFTLSIKIYESITVVDANEFPAIPDEAVFSKALGWQGGLLKTIFNNLGTIIMMLLMYLVGWFGEFAIFSVAIANSLILLARILFSPLGAAQCFDDGTRSAGIRYLKLLLADMLTYAAIIALVWASCRLSSVILLSVYNGLSGDFISYVGSIADIPLNNEKVLRELIHSKMFLGCAFAIRLALVGGIVKANQLAKEIVGI